MLAEREQKADGMRYLSHAVHRERGVRAGTTTRPKGSQGQQMRPYAGYGQSSSARRYGIPLYASYCLRNHSAVCLINAAKNE